jgi:DNA-binding GntR family transcriptional regulator
MNGTVSKLAVEPLHARISLRDQAYDELKRAITQMDLDGNRSEIRLDERQLSQDLGISLTPIREAMSLLEQEGFVRTEARRGIFVVRKSKVDRSMADHLAIIEALERRDTEQAGQLAQRHTLELAAHVEHYCTYLD